MMLLVENMAKYYWFIWQNILVKRIVLKHLKVLVLKLFSD